MMEMIDSMVGQAVIIRTILGLPERELVEDTSQEEGIGAVCRTVGPYICLRGNLTFSICFLSVCLSVCGQADRAN